jgi:hypothetical protein
MGLLGCARLSRRVRYRVAFPHPWRRDLFPALAYVLLVGLGVLLVASEYPSLSGAAAADPTLLLDWLTAVTFLLLIQTALSAWEMLLYMGPATASRPAPEPPTISTAALSPGARPDQLPGDPRGPQY